MGVSSSSKPKAVQSIDSTQFNDLRDKCEKRRWRKQTQGEPCVTNSLAGSVAQPLPSKYNGKSHRAGGVHSESRKGDMPKETRSAKRPTRIQPQPPSHPTPDVNV